MTQHISVEAGAVLRGAEAVSGAHSDIVSSIQHVRSTLDELSHAWKSNAASAYATLLASWNDDAARLTGILNEFEAALRATHRDQVATEGQHQVEIAHLMSIMGDAHHTGRP